MITQKQGAVALTGTPLRVSSSTLSSSHTHVTNTHRGSRCLWRLERLRVHRGRSELVLRTSGPGPLRSQQTPPDVARPPLGQRPASPCRSSLAIPPRRTCSYEDAGGTGLDGSGTPAQNPLVWERLPMRTEEKRSVSSAVATGPARSHRRRGEPPSGWGRGGAPLRVLSGALGFSVPLSLPRITS